MKPGESSILLIGAGAIGLNVLRYLSDLGFMDIHVTDNENVNFLDTKLKIYPKRFYGEPRVEIAENMLKTPNIKWYRANISERSNFEKLVRMVDLVVSCTESLSMDVHDYINKVCIKNGKNWISARLLNNSGEVGPFVIPLRSPCFKCYEMRVKSNLGGFHAINAVKPNYENSMAGKSIISAYTFLEILKIIKNPASAVTLNSVLSVNFENYETTLDLIPRAENCPVCKVDR